jgi:hypothetical protein
VCSPFRAAHDWWQAELAREGRVVDERDGLPRSAAYRSPPELWHPDHDTRGELATPATRSS